MKKFLALLLAVMMLMSIAACGKKDPGTSADPAGSGNANGGTAATAKDSVVLATSGEPYRFMAQSSKSCSGDDNLVLSNVYDCLLLLEPDGSLSEALAEKYDVSEDGLTYTFYLRKGVKFHDGSELTAEDVKFTYDLGAAGPIGSALFINLESTEIIDEYTVAMHLSAPYAAYPYGVASRLGGIISKAYYEQVGEEGYLEKPIGTGPYKLVEAVSGSHITMEAFADYWRGTPPITNVTIEIVADTNTQILGLQNGDYDAIRNPSIEVCTRFDSVDGVDWNYTDSTGRITLYLSAWVGHDWDLNFRKAVQHAINKEDINQATNSGYATILDIDMCPMYGGYPTEGIEKVAYDRDKAIEYLSASNYDGKKEYAILVQSGTTYEVAAKVIQAQLIDIGINCTITSVDGLTKNSMQQSRDFDALVGENLSSLVDADGVMSYFLFNRLEPARMYAREEELCDLFMEGRALQGEDRLPYYVEGCNIITEEAYMVPLYNGVITVAHNSALQGAQAHCLGNFNFYYWSWAK